MRDQDKGYKCYCINCKGLTSMKRIDGTRLLVCDKCETNYARENLEKSLLDMSDIIKASKLRQPGEIPSRLLPDYIFKDKLSYAKDKCYCVKCEKSTHMEVNDDTKDLYCSSCGFNYMPQDIAKRAKILQGLTEDVLKRMGAKGENQKISDNINNIITEEIEKEIMNDSNDMIQRCDKTRPALQTQIDGDHYINFPIQPVEFIVKGELSFLQGCIVKRICRYNLKGTPLKDLQKAKHEIDLIIELEGLGEDDRPEDLEE